MELRWQCFGTVQLAAAAVASGDGVTVAQGARVAAGTHGSADAGVWAAEFTVVLAWRRCGTCRFRWSAG